MLLQALNDGFLLIEGCIITYLTFTPLYLIVLTFSVRADIILGTVENLYLYLGDCDDLET